MSFKKIVLSLVLVLAPLAVLGQTKTIKGVIYEEETGETMPGATVSVVGSTKGVMTDLDGSFELSGVKPTDKLKFECLGKETQILEVGSMTNFIVKLKNAANELDEVTIVAFGKQRKESTVAAITTVDVGTLKVPSSNLTTALAGNRRCDRLPALRRAWPGQRRLLRAWYHHLRSEHQPSDPH